MLTVLQQLRTRAFIVCIVFTLTGFVYKRMAHVRTRLRYRPLIINHSTGGN
jgi:hypothetical protein